MDCTEFLNRYSEYDDSLVPLAEVDRFRSHMAVCDACTRYDRVLRKGRMLARQAPDVEPSDDFVPRLHLRLWDERCARARAAERPAQTASVLAAMTVLLVVTGTFGLLARAADSADTPASQWYTAAPAPSVQLANSMGSFHLAGGRGLPVLPPVLSPLSLAAARPWTSERVDPAGLASYSPLVTGPPAYRGGRPYSGASISAYRTLD